MTAITNGVDFFLAICYYAANAAMFVFGAALIPALVLLGIAVVACLFDWILNKTHNYLFPKNNGRRN